MQTHRFVRNAGTLLVVFLALTSFGWAQHAAKSQSPNHNDGQVVAVDDKGTPRQATREEIEELLKGVEPLVNQSTDGLAVIPLADGGVAVDLEDRFQNVAIAKVNADGTVSQACVKSGAEAEAFLNEEKAEAKPAAPAKKVSSGAPKAKPAAKKASPKAADTKPAAADLEVM